MVLRRGVVLVLALAALAGCGRGVAAPAGYSVKVTPVMQSWEFNCIPATGVMFLSALGVHVSQELLAAQMYTPLDDGTFDGPEVRALDLNLAARRMDVTGVMGLDNAQLAETLTGQLEHGHLVLLTVWGNLLPWRWERAWEGHGLVAAGIRGDVVTVWDPETRAKHGGWHRITVPLLNRALEKDAPSVFTVVMLK